MEYEREDYYRKKAIDTQRGIVSYKSSTTLTSEAFIWTYRTTSCDVISIITTVAPIKDGLMKDIKLENREVRRLKPALLKKSGKPSMKGSPFESEFSIDVEASRKKMNRLLMSEKKNFMAKLNISRFLRTKVENDAATKLQAVYRGHYTRISMLDIEQNSLVNRKIRSNIRSYLANRFKMKLSLASYKQTRQIIRNKSSTLIQCLFMRYLSRKCLRRRRHEHRLSRRLRGAITIQAIVRGASARARVKLLVERIRMVVSTKSALRIQIAYRGMLARRKVCRRRIKLRLLASRAIQNWFRAKYSRQMAAHIKQMMYIKNTNRGALLVQGAVRRFVARRRVDRIRLRRLHKVIFKCVTSIQTLIRKFLGKVTVRRRRELFLRSQTELTVQNARRVAEEDLARSDLETKTLLESVDLFLQARAGRTSEVEDIFKGLVSTESHTNVDVDASTGDTLLTIAASTGNTDLLRKCLLWGFEINHRNDEGLSALLLTVKHNHFPAMQYLLAPPSVDNGEFVGINGMLDPLSVDDMGYLLVTATTHAGRPTEDLAMLSTLLEIEGMDVNAKMVSTGQTAVHAACEIGSLAAFKLLAKYKANLELTDELGQSVLHKASGSSLKIAQLVLGLDPAFNTYMSEVARTVSILAVDGDGKDCVLLAALSGQTELLDLYESILKTSPDSRPLSKSGKKPSFSAVSGTGSFKLSSAEDIGWTPNDVVRALQLVQNANLVCVQKIIQIGFDPNWPEEGTGTTMAIAACRCGDVDMIDLLMTCGADFSAADSKARTAMHYASVCNGTASARDDTHASSVVVHLLTHSSAQTCNLSAKCLTVCDSNGDNPLHWAARAGISLEVDLLARSSLCEALATRNKDGFTPLLLACSYMRDNLIHAYIKLGADVLATDKDERGCLWHLFHPHFSALQNDRSRPFCSEFCSQSSIPSVAKAFGSSARKEKDDDAVRLSNDISTLVVVLQSGCSLYTNHALSPEDMLRLEHSPESVPTSLQQQALQSGDILVQELSLSALKTLLQASILTSLDAWRLLLSSIRFDDGSLKVFMALLRGGVIDLLTQDAPGSRPLTAGGEGAAMLGGSLSPPSGNGMDDVRLVGSPATVGSKHTKPKSAERSTAAGGASENYQISRLQDVFFLDLTAVGWIVRLGSCKALQILVRKGHDTTLPVDSLQGDACLHYVARHGSPDMIDTVMTDRRARLEQVNGLGETAGMIAAKLGRFSLAKRLFEFRASPRRSLEGCYAAWVLAHVRRKEHTEMNIQTGRFGDDDIAYHDIAPDPFYTTWYTWV